MGIAIRRPLGIHTCTSQPPSLGPRRLSPALGPTTAERTRLAAGRAAGQPKSGPRAGLRAPTLRLHHRGLRLRVASYHRAAAVAVASQRAWPVNHPFINLRSLLSLLPASPSSPPLSLRTGPPSFFQQSLSRYTFSASLGIRLGAPAARYPLISLTLRSLATTRNNPTMPLKHISLPKVNDTTK